MVCESHLRASVKTRQLQEFIAWGIFVLTGFDPLEQDMFSIKN
jgi:hypothetical protein